MTLSHLYETIRKQPQFWSVALMDFVDDFRRQKDAKDVQTFEKPPDPNIGALMASIVEYLCKELSIPAPAWALDYPSLPNPWFVAGVENLKAIALVESPVVFRKRKIFVLSNFLTRV